MKIISLNTWGGRALQPLIEFFRDFRDHADIFCLQEMHDTTQEYRERNHPDEYVRWDLLKHTSKALHGYQWHFARFRDNPDRMSVATFWRPSVNVVSSGQYEVYRPRVLVETGSAVRSPRSLISTTVMEAGRDVMVINYHGAWTPDGKGDSGERNEEIGNLLSFLSERDGPVILCGDLNLQLDTEAIRRLEAWGFINLIRKNSIRDTRTHLYRHYGTAITHDADYIMVTPDVRVVDFRVHHRPLVSDHAFLSLEFTL